MTLRRAWHPAGATALRWIRPGGGMGHSAAWRTSAYSVTALPSLSIRVCPSGFTFGLLGSGLS
jgi:hypothetical protein